MSLFLKTIEHKIQSFDYIDKAIQSSTIEDILELYNKYEEYRYILYRYPDLFSEDILIKLLRHKDTYVSFKAASILTEIYQNKKHRREYIVYIKYMLKEDITYEQKNQLLSIFVRFLSCKSNLNFDLEERKREFLYNENFLLDLILIKELQYNIMLIIYIYSFNTEYYEILSQFKRHIITILRDKSREKILRICYNVLVNLLNYNMFFTIREVCVLRKITLNLCGSSISDESLISNLHICKQILNEKYSKYTLKDYINDLFSGILEDNDFHHNENFWHLGIPHILKNKMELMRILKKYLKSHNNKWIHLACNDIYMLVTVCPQINDLITKLKIREILFALCKHENDEIRFQAIQALYACIFTEWN